MLAEAEVHGDGGVDREGVEPALRMGVGLALRHALGLVLRLGTPTDERGDLEAFAWRECGAELAEDVGVEVALGGSGVEVDFDSADSGKASGLKEVIGRGATGGFVVLESRGCLDADDGFSPDGRGDENALVARDDFDCVGDEDAIGEEGHTEALRVGGAQVFRFLPGP
jgi:hypothetical protein